MMYTPVVYGKNPDGSWTLDAEMESLNAALESHEITSFGEWLNADWIKHGENHERERAILIELAKRYAKEAKDKEDKKSEDVT